MRWWRDKTKWTCGMALVVAALTSGRALACPFCVALRPTLTQQRDAADVVALGEFRGTDSGGSRFVLHQIVKDDTGSIRRGELRIEDLVTADPGALFMLLGEPSADGDAESIDWLASRVTETSWAYIVRAPSLRQPSSERLPYFARYLEHADPVVAGDAIMEFAHAPFDDVAAVADALPMESLRHWIVDEGVLGERKGFYGLALGLAGSDEDRETNERLLRELIEMPVDDFRAGFDGMLGGYLVLTGTTGLELIESRILANPRSADGDVRHAMSALRFYYEYGREIPQERLQVALRHLLDRPEFAAATIIDLARWQDWEVVARVAALFDLPESIQPATRRAVVGYLLACPSESAAVELSGLRATYPSEVAEAERRLTLLGGAL